MSFPKLSPQGQGTTVLGLAECPPYLISGVLTKVIIKKMIISGEVLKKKLIEVHCHTIKCLLFKVYSLRSFDLCMHP